MDRPILAKAIETCHMEDDPEDVWIVKGKNYYLTPVYRFTDEQGDTHYIDMWELDDYFNSPWARIPPPLNYLVHIVKM